jgi:hypothetical protein
MNQTDTIVMSDCVSACALRFRLNAAPKSVGMISPPKANPSVASGRNESCDASHTATPVILAVGVPMRSQARRVSARTLTCASPDQAARNEPGTGEQRLVVVGQTSALNCQSKRTERKPSETF